MHPTLEARIHDLPKYRPSDVLKFLIEQLKVFLRRKLSLDTLSEELLVENTCRLRQTEW